MRTLFGLLVVLLVGIAALGFYRGWFHFSTASADQKSSVTITVDQEKLHADEGKAREKMEELGQKAKEKTGVQADKVEQPARQP